MSELWRKLPDLVGAGELRMNRTITDHETIVYYGYEDYERVIHNYKPFRDTNPCDALINLMIWAKGLENK